MVVVIDANVLISACIKIDGHLANLIISHSSTINYVVPAFVLSEIKEKELKICKSCKIGTIEFNQNLLILLIKILIINDGEISDDVFKKHLT